jgi:transcriptional regulator with XRE-family HTH domain
VKEVFMGMTEKIRILLVKRGNISEAELARRMGTSPQNFNSKMKRESFSEEDLREIARVLDSTFSAGFTLNDTGETI